MANFCYQCASELFGEENAARNDFAGFVRGNERYYVLCEGCGWITVDKHGKKVDENEE
jgi:RNase P subunit RPR2